MANQLLRTQRDAARERAKDKAREAMITAPSEEMVKAQNEFPFFCKYVTRNSERPIVLAKHHLGWVKHWITGKDSENLVGIAGVDIDLLAPRGSAKSTVLGLFLAWSIGKHALAKRVLQILYVSNSIELARAKSAAIKDIISSPEYQEVFPTVIPAKHRWADSYWAIDFSYAGIKSSGTERFTMIAAGVKGGIVSKRFNLVIFDDLIKSVDEMATGEARVKLEKLVSSSINPTLLPGGRKLSLGTRFRPDDIHCTAFTPDKGWYQIQESAILIDEEGNEYSFWEEWLKLEVLQGRRQEDPLAFAYQYQNTIVPLEDIGLEPGWIYFENIPTEFDNYVVGVDLAASLKQKADYTVMMLLGVLDGKFYFLDYRRGKWQGNLQILDALLGMYEEWYEDGVPFNIYVESVAYQSSLQGDFQRYVVNEKGLYDINCYPYRLKGDKLAHLLSISGAYASGVVRYNKYKFKLKDEVIDELVNFGSKSHDDCLDASAIALQAAGVRKRIEGR